MTYGALDYTQGNALYEARQREYDRRRKIVQYNNIVIRREAKVKIGNYENTTISVELSASIADVDKIADVYSTMLNDCDEMLRTKIDDIELGKRNADSRASRFGV